MHKMILFMAALSVAGVSTAQISPRGVITDSRIKVVSYDPNQVTRIVGTFGYATTIELEKGEYITYRPAVGNLPGWHIDSEQYSNQITIKPKLEHASTNFNITTNRGRNYTFYLVTEDGKYRPTFRVKFSYPNPDYVGIFSSKNRTRGVLSRFGSHRQVNDHYSFWGDGMVAPIKAKDNGKFTLLKFRKGSPIPAILAVDRKTRRESLVNYRMQDGYVILEGVHSQYSLRYGDHVACLFNDKALNIKV